MPRPSQRHLALPLLTAALFGLGKVKLWARALRHIGTTAGLRYLSWRSLPRYERHCLGKDPPREWPPPAGRPLVQESVWQKLSGAGLALHSELSLRAVLRTLVDQATSVTDARSSVVSVLDRSGADFEHSVGNAELLRHGPADADRAMLEVPIVIRGVPYAQLVVAGKRDRETFTREDAEALALLSEQAAVAIENARRYESATRQLAEVEALGEITDTLVGELDLSRLLVGVTERLQALLDARGVFAFLPTAD